MLFMELFTHNRHDIAPSAALTVRHLAPRDLEPLRRLAALDSSRVPAGEVLVADVGGELWAAISVDDRHTIADPFRPTRPLVALLEARARQLRRAGRARRPRFGRFRPAFG
jgi:hypothetical protein